jgi:hypothetical protein
MEMELDRTVIPNMFQDTLWVMPHQVLRKRHIVESSNAVLSVSWASEKVSLTGVQISSLRMGYP